MNKWGIDTSRWQGDFDLKSTGASFVLIKAGGSDDGLYIDSQFLNTYTKAKNAGIPCGIYWYSQAVSVTNLKNEITYLKDKIKGLQFELPIFLDLEEAVQYDYIGALAVEWINSWMASGYYPGIYSSYSWWVGNLATMAKTIPADQKWVAFWGTDGPGIDCGFWQDGTRTIHNVTYDSDYCYADYSFIKEKGLNGFMKKQYFSDVTANRSDYKAIQWLASNLYVKGYKDGTFKPDQPITRGQLAMILWKMAGCPNGD